MPARRPADPIASYRNRANAATGQAAEERLAAELAGLGATVWRPGANTIRRANRDAFDLFDILAMTGTALLCWQVKATAREPRLEPLWRTRFLALPKPPGCRFLLAWLTPADGWRVWRLLPDGTRLEMPWPPVPGGDGT